MKSKSDIKIKYGDNIIDEIENRLAKELSNSININIMNTILNMIPEGKKYLLTLVDETSDKETQVILLMKKYSIIEDDLEFLEIIKSKIREYNIDIILKNN